MGLVLLLRPRLTRPCPRSTGAAVSHPRLDRLRAVLHAWRVPIRVAWWGLVLGYVGWKLSAIGWASVLANLPDQPGFYLIYLVAFLVLPGSERWIYRLIWGARIGWVPLLRKRSLNNVVIGYSGDLDFYLWCRTHLKLPDRHILAGIKDSSVLSGMAGTLVTAGLVLGFLALGQGALVGRMVEGHQLAAIGIGAVTLLLVPLAWRFRQSLLWIDGGRAAQVFAIHLARVVAVLLLQVLQWWAAMPAAPLSTWLLFVTAQSLVGQLPLVPNRDILFLAIGLELTRGRGVDPAALAGLLVATALLKQVTNLLVLAATGLVRGRSRA